MNICLDTMILVWGIQFYENPEQIEGRAASEEQREFLRTASAALATWLSNMQGKDDVVFTIPAPVITEYLTWFRDFDTRQQELERLEQWATIPPLGTPAADRAADLFRRFRNDHGWPIPKGERPKVKVDAMIAAIADLAGVDSILTDNESDFVHHAKYIQPEILSLRSLPKPEQSDLVMRLGMKPLLDKLED